MNIIVENIPKMEKNTVMELGVVFIVVVGIASIGGCVLKCMGRYGAIIGGNAD